MSLERGPFNKLTARKLRGDPYESQRQILAQKDQIDLASVLVETEKVASKEAVREVLRIKPFR